MPENDRTVEPEIPAHLCSAAPENRRVVARYQPLREKEHEAGEHRQPQEAGEEPAQEKPRHLHDVTAISLAIGSGVTGSA